MWSGTDDDNWDIYVKAVGTGTKPLRITEGPAFHSSPTWSPDGRQIAFVRATQDGAAVYTVPSMGGQERKLVDLVGEMIAAGSYWVPIVCWAPDGNWLAIGEKASVEAPARIVRISLATLEKRPLTAPVPGSLGDLEPQISPDGRFLAFVRSGARTWGNQDVWVQPVAGGEARRLTFGQYPFGTSLSWTPNGNEILFSLGTPSAGGRMARVSLAGGAPQPVVGVGENALQASVRGNRMVYIQSTPWVENIWRVPNPASSRPTDTPERLLVDGSKPTYSPDGRRMAFESRRGGPAAVWLSAADGSRPSQLTSFKSDSGTARWSPDGRRLVFDSLEAGNWDVYVVGIDDGGAPRRLTEEPSEDATATWSRDGHSIYFHSDRTGRAEIWRTPSDGGAAVQVTRAGGYYGVESADGQYLYYSKAVESGIWRVPLAGGDESEVVKGHVQWQGWALGRGGIYYATLAVRVPVRREELTIQYLDFATGRATPLLRREGAYHQDLAVSPDEKWILFGEAAAWQADLVLIENFR